MACGCQCSCPTSDNRTYQQSPNWQSMMGSKLVSKPGMSLKFLQNAMAAMEIVDVDGHASAVEAQAAREEAIT